MGRHGLLALIGALLLVGTALGDTKSLKSALDLIEQGQEGYTQELLQLVAIPSVSALPERLPDIRAAAEWVRDRLERAGLENVRVLETEGPRPVVYGDWLHAGRDAPTAIIYSHYDVQPADPEALWSSPPFEPEVRGGYLFGRGADDDKGGLLPPIQAAEAVLQAAGGKLPVNLKFMIEGEEEIGSPHLEAFLASNLDLLKADFVLSADGGQISETQPSLTLGLRGAAALEVEVRALAADVHSGLAGGAVQNPARALAQLLATMWAPNGSVAVPHFYRGVRPVTAEDRGDMLALNYDDRVELVAGLGAVEAHGEAGFTSLERIWLRPTLEVVGLTGGFGGEGIKTIVPASARAKLAARLVPGQAPKEVLALLEAHISRNHPPACNVTVRELGFSAHPYLMARHSPVNTAAATVLKKVMGRAPLYIRNGATIPALALFQQVMGIDTTLFAFGLPDSSIHAPNEHYKLSMYRLARQAYARLFFELALLPKAALTEPAAADKGEL